MQPEYSNCEFDLDRVLDDLNFKGFSLIDQLHPLSLMQKLTNECTQHLNAFREAQIQNGVVSQIRSDHILWIDDQLPIAQQHIDVLHALGQEINRAFYTGIQNIEAHYARYNAGEFYALHRDNPQQKNHRVISSVYYLHQTWQDSWGGQLRLEDKNGEWHIIQPQPNRLVIFQSDLLHEVLMSHQQRLSITAWLRSASSAWSN